MAVNPQSVSSSAAASPLSDNLEMLARIGQDFAASLDVSRTLERALTRIATHLDAEAASLFVLDDGDSELICQASFGPVDVTGLRIQADQGIVGRAVAGNDCQMVRDVRLDPDFARTVDDDTGFTTLSILCAPMSVKDRCVGAIELINKTSGDGLFSEEDRHVLQSLASSAALALINARLTSQLIEQEKLRRELELAAEIQRNLLPCRREPSFPVCGVNKPARSVSGDFYDVFELEDGRIAFSVGDVSGKGMNAALLMAKTSSLYRCLGKTTDDPGMLLAQVNGELCETGTRGMFVTLVGGVYDPVTDTVRMANAGHEPPLLRARDGAFRAFPAEAPPLGIAVDLVGVDGYPVTECKLDGGCLAVFTDGITEWKDGSGEMLGARGLKSLLRELAPLPAGERLDALVARLDSGDRPLHDDMTLLLVECARAAADETLPAGPAARGSPVAQLRIAARVGALKRVRDMVREAAQSCGCSAACTRDFVIAVDEACQNVIRHAYGEDNPGDILIEVTRGDGQLMVSVVDFAPPVDPATIHPRPLEELRPGVQGAAGRRRERTVDGQDDLLMAWGWTNELRDPECQRCGDSDIEWRRRSREFAPGP
jgi:sigma-B regulation protein RsbU (phosphoserine phosphatase)